MTHDEMKESALRAARRLVRLLELNAPNIILLDELRMVGERVRNLAESIPSRSQDVSGGGGAGEGQ
jgi:hypothetical protein